MMKTLSTIFIFLFFLSCSKSHNNIENLSKAYVDILVAKEKYSDNYKKFLSVKDSIYQKYILTDTLYRKGIKELGSDKELWKEFSDSSVSYLNMLRSKLKKRREK